jgi:hypothetical protein
MLAVVSVTGLDGTSREALVKRSAELLGGFQIRHLVEFV